MVGKAMSSNESRSYEIMTSLGVDYVLIIFGGMIGYSGDDINKFLWMVRIAQGEHPQEIHEADYFTKAGAYSMGADVSDRMKNSLMYKLSYYRFGEIVRGYGQPGGYDLARREEIGHKNIELEYVEEAFTSENWLVRVYRVLKERNIDKTTLERKQTEPKKVYKRKQTTKGRFQGVIKNKVVVNKPPKSTNKHLVSDKSSADKSDE